MSYQDNYNKILNKYTYVGMNTLLVNKKGIFLSTNGYQDLEKQILLKEDTIFRIASISKVEVALGALKLYEQGLLDLNEDISKYLGYKIINPYFPNAKITCEMLMTQTSSISDGGDNVKGYDGVNGPKLYVPLEELLTNKQSKYYLDKTFTNHLPGTHFEYSNFGCGILACIIEKVSGKYFSDFIREVLLLPLNIDGSYRISDIKAKEKVASLYDYNEKNNQFILMRNLDQFLDYEYPKYPLGDNYRMPAGGLFISIIDLGKIMKMLMNKGSYQGKVLFNVATIELMEEVHWQGESKDDLMYKKKGLQLIILDDYTKKPLKGHFGFAYGLRSFMLYNEEIGIIGICNGGNYYKKDPKITALQDDTIKFMIKYKG